MIILQEIIKFFNKDFGNIRGCNINGIPYLVGKDIVDLLGYENGNRDIVRHVDEDDRIMLDKTQYQNGIEFDYKELGQRGGWVINESGFYSLIFGSELPSAKLFKKWVTSEVLPQIRMTGGYIPIEKNDSDELIMARAVKIADATIKKKDEIIAQKDKLLEEQKPMVEQYKTLMDVKGTFSMGEVAHFVGIGEYRLFKYLREIGILFYNENDDNVPYENMVNRSKFRVVPGIAPDGSVHSVTRVMPNGIDYICKKLREYGYLEVSAS